jgi:PPK2 family polyphosphate:nucleotide phosphotransferase
MKINPNSFRVPEGRPFNLQMWPTRIDPVYESKKDYKEKLEEHVEELSELQPKLYAESQHALLLIFQGMDTSGKDSAISHLTTGVNPMGFQVFSFKAPSSEELKHDFLWRTTVRLPERGRIGLFNRSYYEEVVVVRVHPAYLAGQNLPPRLLDKKSIWKQRYQSINEFESHLARSGTRVVKFYLHLSKAEQGRRLLERIEEKEKNWKFNPADLDERKLWPKYLQAYQESIAATSTKQAPWYVLPADDQRTARLLVVRIVLDELKKLNPKFPQPSREAKKAFDASRKLLRAELGDQPAAED